MGSDVVLIGFQDQGNLGIGYVAATLRREGFRVHIVDFQEEPKSILRTIRTVCPVLVGFSVIFQYYALRFGKLAAYLRDNGISCHFTAGGHYPSLCYEEMLREVPQLDSIVRFEGELTAAELVECLAEGREWRKIQGIAFRDGERFIATAPRPLVADLDLLPYPDRPADSALMVLGRKATAIVASRGCCRNCSFCSIRQFYYQVPGAKVRVRNPASVVQEMKALYENSGTSIFLFQDDDFPIWGAFGQRWAARFTDSLRSAGLYGRVIWKISCRSDEIQEDLFLKLRDAGLFMVYLGIESGNETGLRTLNKQITADDSLRAAATLKALGLALGYGFMLFDPSSTLDSLKTNVRFLRQLTADGSCAAIFCKMLPYAGTPIAQNLKEAGPLRGSIDHPDYDFLDPRVQILFETLDSAVASWIASANSISSQISFAWQEYWIVRRLCPEVGDVCEYEHALRTTTSRYNQSILQLVEDAISGVEAGRSALRSRDELRSSSESLLAELLKNRNDFIYSHQSELLAAIGIPV